MPRESSAAHGHSLRGVAVAEFEADVPATMRRVICGFSSEAATLGPGMLTPGKGFLHDRPDPRRLPAWLDKSDFDYVVAEFQRTGFRGGLNWYRAFSLSRELMQPWSGAAIRQPSLFIGGSRDDVIKFPMSQAAIERLPQNLPGLRGLHILEGVGHRIQRQRAAEVNALLLEFLTGL